MNQNRINKNRILWMSFFCFIIILLFNVTAVKAEELNSDYSFEKGLMKNIDNEETASLNETELIENIDSESASLNETELIQNIDSETASLNESETENENGTLVENLSEVNVVSDIKISNQDSSLVPYDGQSSPNIETRLALGSSGTEVSNLQKYLEQLGYIEANNYKEGVYDQSTSNAVSIFQAYNGLKEPDGIVGAWTREIIKNNPVAFSDFVYGEKTERAFWIQNILYNNGFLIVSPDSIWGNKSQKAVKTLNLYNDTKAEDLESVNLSFLSLLLDKQCPKINDISGRYIIGDNNSQIKKIYAKLFLDGFGEYYNKTIYDQDLEAMIYNYQLLGGLTPDGIIGNWTISNLNNNKILFYVIKKGDKSSTVKTIQDQLITLGFLTVPSDGSFGNYTEKAIKDFQASFLLASNGEYNLLTSKKMFEIFKWINSDTISFGQEGEDVKLIQRQLLSLDYLFIKYIDGVFDEATKNAVIIFQINNGLSTPDGKVGKWTKPKLICNGKRYCDLNKGDKNNSVLALQQYLNNNGLLNVTPDGSYGNYTANVVLSIQESYGQIQQSGNLDKETWIKLLELCSLANNYSIKFNANYSVGSTGNNINYLQNCLIMLNYATFSADASFAGLTYGALLSFQLNNNLEATGIFDKATIIRLLGTNATKFFSRQKGDSDKDQEIYIFVLQKKLQHKNFLNAIPDGIFGYYTDEAVRAFQSAKNLQITGIVDAETAMNIFSLNPSAVRTLCIAKNQLGYIENADGSTKYGVWYGNYVNDTSFTYGEWCAMFVSWCGNQSGTLNSEIPFFAWVPTGVNWYKNKGHWIDRNDYPNVGDVIFFDWGVYGNGDHVGFVASVNYSTGEITTVEGNTGSESHVGSRTININSPYIIGYGTFSA